MCEDFKWLLKVGVGIFLSALIKYMYAHLAVSLVFLMPHVGFSNASFVLMR